MRTVSCQSWRDDWISHVRPASPSVGCCDSFRLLGQSRECPAVSSSLKLATRFDRSHPLSSLHHFLPAVIKIRSFRSFPLLPSHRRSKREMSKKNEIASRLPEICLIPPKLGTTMSNKHGLASGSDSEQSDSAQSSVKAKRARTTGGSSLPGSSPPPLASKGKRPAPEQEGEKDDAEDEESEEESEGEQRRTQRDLKRARRAEKKAGVRLRLSPRCARLC